MARSGDERFTPPELAVQPSDVERLINDAKEGDRQALGELVAQCRGYLLAIAHAELDDTLRGKLAVSDVVQETLLRAQQNLPGFRGADESDLLGWVRQILINYIADVRRAYRQTDKRNINREVQLPWSDHSTAGLLDGFAFDSATPGRAAAAGEESKRLGVAIAELPEEYRTVLKLRTWERLPFAEIGKRMERSADAARMLWARAVQQLASSMRDGNDESC